MVFTACMIWELASTATRSGTVFVIRQTEHPGRVEISTRFVELFYEAERLGQQWRGAQAGFVMRWWSGGS